MFDTKWSLQRREPDLLKGVLAGLLGGLAASWVMGQFQATVPAATFQKLLGESSGDANGSSDEDPATVKTAKVISEEVLDHGLAEEEKEWAGSVVHFGFGASVGTAYGLLAEAEPRVTAGAGLPFGTVVWALADEAAVPALGLSDPPWAHPPSTHVYALASHLVYGLTAEAVRRLVRHLL